MDLAQVLRHLKNEETKIDPNLIVGLSTSDDAGVYKIREDYALIQTLDFFTPIVDDPYVFGTIAAANALSDVYAMGGRPLTAMNIACFATCLESEVLADILRGGADKIKEAEAVLVGGHTVTDNEVKYGLSVTGFVHPDKVMTNAGAKPGDVLFLTKPIGTGILSTALRSGLIDEKAIFESVSSMSTLNKGGGLAMEEIGANGCTDITGFGVIGHVFEMADASGVDIELIAEQVPVMDRVLELIRLKAVPGGLRFNRKYFEPHVVYQQEKEEALKMALFDPQTSGGLLIAVPENKAELMKTALIKHKTLRHALIGRVRKKEGDNSRIIVS